MKNGKQKVGLLFSLPVCIVATFFVFPIGLILVFMRLYKKGKISKRAKDVGVGLNGALIVVLLISLFTLPEVDTSGQASKPIPTASENISSAQSEEAIPPEQLNETPSAESNSVAPVATEPLQEEPASSDPASISPQPEPSSTPELSSYELLLATLRSDIDSFLAADEQDTEMLRDDYELLLSLRVNEYVYKTFGYGYFTDNYKNEQFDYLLEETNSICAEMKEHFDESEVNEYLIYCMKMAGQSYDRFDYKEYLIGTETSPDLDAMWERFIEISLGMESE